MLCFHKNLKASLKMLCPLKCLPENAEFPKNTVFPYMFLIRKHKETFRCNVPYIKTLHHTSPPAHIKPLCSFPQPQESGHGWDSGPGKGDLTAPPAFLMDTFTPQQEPLAPSHQTSLHQRVGPTLLKLVLFLSPYLLCLLFIYIYI